jgi:DeoR family glycerol-3-phosphate regulon repressor
MRALARHGACSISDLARQLAVSDETIRRDVKAMAGKGLVERVHGGAALPQLLSEPAFAKRMERHAAAKQRIALSAAAQVRNGDSLILDAGSTTAYVARALGDHSNLLVVTNCTDIARTLVARNRVYLAGGELHADDGAVFGDTAYRFVEQFRVDHAVLSIGAIDHEDGLMNFHVQEAEFSRAVMRRAMRTIVVADHSKFASHAPVKVCGFADIDLLITDRPPPADLVGRLSAAGSKTLIAD